MYVLTVIHPPVNGAAYGRAVVLDPVPYLAVKRQVRYLLETECGVNRDESTAFALSVETGRAITHEPSGFTFRIDPADNAPHACPCGEGEDDGDPCGRLVLPTDHALATHDNAFCLGCYPWDITITPCLPANTAHTEEN